MSDATGHNPDERGFLAPDEQAQSRSERDGGPLSAPTDRGQTQPATPAAPADGNGGYAGYGRFAVPAPNAAPDASTVISDPGRHPDNRSLAAAHTPATPVHQRVLNASAPPISPSADYPAPYAPGVTFPPPSVAPVTRGVFTRFSRRGKLLTVGALVAILLLASVSYGVFQYAPAQPATRFCRDLTTQRYADAYTLTTQRARAGRSQAQFARDLTTLDSALGAVISCEGDGLLPVGYRLPGGVASYHVALVRQRAGASARTLTGILGLSAAHGWQVDAIDTSLLGVNLGALEAAQSYCDALGTQRYAAAYDLLAASAQADLTPGDYATVEQLHTVIGGPVKTCGVTDIGQGNSDSRASLTLTINRATLSAKSAAITLTLTGGVWRLAAVPSGAEGPDVGPYEVGQRYCADLAAGQFDAAYDLFTPQYQAQNPRAQFVGALQTTRSQGATIACGAPDLTTYSVSGDAARYVVPYIEIYLGLPLSTNDTLTFARQNGHWLIANTDLQSPLG